MQSILRAKESATEVSPSIPKIGPLCGCIGAGSTVPSNLSKRIACPVALENETEPCYFSTGAGM